MVDAARLGKVPPASPARAALAFVRLGRPKFLAGGFALYGLGAAVAAVRGGFDLRAYVWGQAAITSTQLMTHYANDYFDLAADRQNQSATAWSGGSRVLPAGELPPRVALVASMVFAACALAIAAIIGLRFARGTAAACVLLAALALSWEYSAPPLRLHSRGLGAFTAALVVTVLTPLTAYVLQVGDPVLPLLAATFPLSCAQVAMILVIDFPDAEGDAAAGKRTLVVRWGARAAAGLCIVVVALPYLALPLLASAGLPARAVVAVLATLPFACVLVVSLARGDGGRNARWRRLTWLAVVWLGVLCAAELSAFVSAVHGHEMGNTIVWPVHPAPPSVSAPSASSVPQK